MASSGGRLAALALQVVHVGGGSFGGGLGLAQLRSSGDPLVRQALCLRGGAGGTGGGLPLRLLFCRARLFRLLHLLAGRLVFRWGRCGGESEKGDSEEA